MIQADRFNLRIQCEIRKTDANGSWTSDVLTVNDQMEITAAGFFEVAQVLGQFHELANTIRRQQGEAATDGV